MENSFIPYQAVTQIPGDCILVFASQPGGEVLGCGGAIMHHVAQSISVHVIVVSDGGGGVSEEKATEYARQRQNESIAAADILGYAPPPFLAIPGRTSLLWRETDTRNSNSYSRDWR